MPEYEFILKFSLPGRIDDPVDIAERLGEGGCNDATIGTGIAGVVALDFARDAADAEAAICSAIADVQRALPDAVLLEASPDLVGLSDVADRVGVARQSIRKLWTTNKDFPDPIYSGSVALWHLDDVLKWLKGRPGYDPAPVAIEVAGTARLVNVARERRRHAVSTKIDSLVI